MGYSVEVVKSAKDKIENRRLFAVQEAQFKKNKIFQEIPEAERFEREIASTGVAATLAVLKGGNVKEEVLRLKEKNLQLQKDYQKALESMGYTMADTEPKYVCGKCNDTGYIELDNRTVMCDCLKQAMVECACAQLNRQAPLSLSTFDDFDLSYYSHDIEDGYPRSSYEQMNKIFNYCKEYAKKFSLNSKSLFMKGSTGLGKTHLSLSIANEVIKKGYGVIYVSAPTVVAQLEKEHFSHNKDGARTEDALLECDLLIIDDLGTEFATQFTTSAIYNIFNSRILAGKPVIINTNLTLLELEKLYSQRFVSRITGEAIRLDFFGKDIRILKK